MKYSVALCTYNGELFIEEQLQSILDQTILPCEIIICDDVSSDHTIEIINQFISVQTDLNITWKVHINEKNLGYQANFYKALNLCSEEIIFLCDQDDVWVDSKASKIINHFRKTPQHSVLFTNAFVTDKNLSPYSTSLFDMVDFKKNDQAFFKKNQASILLSRHVATGATMALRKTFLESAGNFESTKLFVHDSWLATLAACFDSLHFIEDQLIYYRQHDKNQIGVLKNGQSNNSKSISEYLIDHIRNDFQRELQVFKIIKEKNKHSNAYKKMLKRIKLLKKFNALTGRKQQLFLTNPKFYFYRFNNFHTLRMYIGNSIRLILNL